MDGAKQRATEPVPLAVAAALAYRQIAGATASPVNVTPLSEILDDVAHALANVVPLYVQDDAGSEPRQLAPVELLQAQFKHGATVLALKDGRQLRGVSVRRFDLMQAVTILKRAHVRFNVGRSLTTV
jgi:hypothetical protein